MRVSKYDKMKFLYRRYWQFLVIIYFIALAVAEGKIILFKCLKHYTVLDNPRQRHRCSPKGSC